MGGQKNHLLSPRPGPTLFGQSNGSRVAYDLIDLATSTFGLTAAVGFPRH
jgi:hypothetical protein